MPVFRAYDPIPAFTFHVSIAGVDVGVFNECQGLSFEREVVEHKEGGTNDTVHMLPGRSKMGKLTLKRGTDPELALLDWFNKGLVNGKVKRDDVSVLIFDRSHKQIGRFDLVDAFPAKYDGPSLRADDVAPAVETLEIVHGGSSGGGGGGGGGGAGAETPDEEAQVVLQDLAEAVYKLMQQDARLDRERLGRR